MVTSSPLMLTLLALRRLSCISHWPPLVPVIADQLWHRQARSKTCLGTGPESTTGTQVSL